MAKGAKAAKKKAPSPQKKKPAKGGRLAPVSLYPLSFDEAVDGLLQVKMEPEKKKA